ncbi:MAG TPA: 3-isopropylmalate dehydratase small subunit [bacterium]|nr:3-isopropylmalate dehydratase small subunit [bacterium]HNT64372.1 3-isopropylmalate dehydratase small subunit [bacterium]HOX85362.1 3-isopropylmalate dehydratase small subunit [bacterium]HPG44521.1 3-isopropylmalate dehydratase small subunit [bacterium]HPM97079.1 3-isopropylmalate dehydratase small subunit [bacterium]
MQIITGRVWKYGDDINTDVIFPGKYTYTVTDPGEMAKIAFEDLDPNFAKQVRPGDIIVAGKNFGCGSSREQAAFCFKYAQVGAVVARSFSRLYFRNCINAGLPALTLPQSPDIFQSGETISVDLQKGIIRCTAGEYSFPPLPEAVLGIFLEGGLIPYTRKALGFSNTQSAEEKAGE